MIVNYVYLFLILLIICFIIYIIYLSYDYNFGNTKEHFDVDLTVDNIGSLNLNTNDINSDLAKFNDNYNKLDIDIHNRNVQKEQKKNLDLLQKTKTNLSISDKLKLMKQNLKPEIKKFPNNKTIKTIKSKYNSQYLSTFTNNNQNYNILANDKCLTVRGLCKDEFCLLNCQNKLYSSNSQFFNTERINNEVDAAATMNVPVETISTDNVYPYNIFKSLINDKCLTISNDGMTVEQCNLNNIKQQWEISPDENICVLE